MDAPATTSKHYDLHFVLNDKRFFWKNPNPPGVTIADAGPDSCLTWESEGRTESRLWTEIATVNLSSASTGKDAMNQCRIAFRDGGSLIVTDGGANGTLDEARTPVYRDFARALNTRLAMAPAGTIAFSAGVSEGRYLGMRIMLAIAALFFVGLPLVLVFVVLDWRVLAVLAAGIGFVWPFWRIVENNTPRRYDPRDPPPELMD